MVVIVYSIVYHKYMPHDYNMLWCHACVCSNIYAIEKIIVAGIFLWYFEVSQTYNASVINLH